MSRIKIKNFGPVKDGLIEDEGWIEVKKVTVFIGNQGSGKSTVAKVIATMLWVEKALNRGDIPEPASLGDFQKYFEYQNLKAYFKDTTSIEYDGDLYYISYNTLEYKYTKATKKKDASYTVPKIMYVPAERSFLSVIKTATSVRGLPEPLFEFAEELRNSQKKYADKEVYLPINGVRYLYDSQADTSYIIGDDYKVDLLTASSGFQSLVPLYLVSLNLSTTIYNGTEISPETVSVDQSFRMNKEISAIMLNKKLSLEDRQKQVDAVEARYLNKAFINIVEEPEQNLFPESQHQLLNSLMTFSGAKKGKLIITTHSPYLINYLSIATFGHTIKEYLNVAERADSYAERLDRIVPLSATVSIKDFNAYQLNEYYGIITKLGTEEGIPSNQNYLNQSLRHGNALFDSLLELEQSI